MRPESITESEEGRMRGLANDTDCMPRREHISGISSISTLPIFEPSCYRSFLCTPVLA